ncbi:MAG: alpha/beta hydrolase [Proteobacteria bacterium]|nr:alpha/beta hydrolase [Pseudomonadota bacterium]
MSRASYHHLLKAPAEGAPLVFAFHGTGGDEHQFAGLIGRSLPEAGIVAPRGDVSERGANRFFRRTAEGVYDMADLERRTVAMAAFIRAHKDENPGVPIFGLGYSNGANILASVLFSTADLFDRVVLMHPLIPFKPKPNAALQGLDLLITAGRRDPICPLPLTQSLDEYFRAQEASVELMLHDGGHEIAPPEVSRTQSFLAKAASGDVTRGGVSG